jgi:hypothetical protein
LQVFKQCHRRKIQIKPRLGMIIIGQAIVNVYRAKGEIRRNN